MACILFSAEIFGICASMVAGTIHVVMSMPKEAVRKARPAIAGLKMFAPSPPNTIFPIAIENAEPITAAQRGRVGGTERASIIPVTTALKSPRELGFFLIRLQSHSVAAAERTQVAISITA